VLWRDTDNLFEATLQDADGDPVNLTDADVTMTIVDRSGGTTMFTQTNDENGHTDAPNGVTRFNVPATPTFDNLAGPRAYTWKYQIVKRDNATGKKNVYFWGDVRVYAPVATV
jgi:hypothetical protein